MPISRNAKVDLLREIPLFSECTRAELAAIAGVADELHLPAGRVLMRQGAVGRELVVIVEGEVTITQDGKTIAVRHGGDFVGELALVTHRPRNATVTTTTDTRVLVVSRRDFDRLMRDVSTIAPKVLRTVADRIPADED